MIISIAAATSSASPITSTWPESSAEDRAYQCVIVNEKNCWPLIDVHDEWDARGSCSSTSVPVSGELVIVAFHRGGAFSR